jgi:two-component system sensor kinase FixL
MKRQGDADGGHATQQHPDGGKQLAGNDARQSAPPEAANDARAAGDRRAVRTYSLRLYLTAMALAVMVPMGILGAFGIQQVTHEYQHAYQDRLRATARLLGIALDSEIQARKVAIMVLAASPLLDQPDSRNLYDFAKRIGGDLGTWVKVSAQGKPLLNTRLPYGAQLPPLVRDVAPARAGQFYVTDVLRVPGVPLPFVEAVGPVVRNGAVVATIRIPFSTDRLRARLVEGLFTGDGVLCLLDGNGVIVARTRKNEEYLGLRVPEWLRAAAAAGEPSVATGHLIDGGEVIVATAHPAEAPDWTVVVAQPIAGYDQEWFRPLMVLAGGGLVLLLALLLLVDRLSLWLVRPLQALTQNARIVARGGRERLAVAPHTSGVAEFETLRLSLNEAAQVMDGRAEAIRVAFASARRERNLLHSVVNGTSDPTYVKDTEGRLVLANAAGLAMLGLHASAALGLILCEPGMAGMDEACRAEDRRVVASGQPVMIERSIGSDADRRTFLGAKSPWRSASGEVLGVVMIVHDITEWKRSENRLREIQGELIRTGRLSAMGAMANGLAHELNQPLAAITNYLGAARRLIAHAPVAPLGVARGAIDDACTQAMRAGEIVSRLRDFIGRGVAAMRIETIDDMIADACALALPQETRGRVSLHVTVEPELESVFVDRLQIQQVLVNLVLNAVQSMADQPRRVLTITAARDRDGDTRIEVADTGTGIPESLLGEVFDPFVSTRRGGLGMGLPIARMIVAAHGGTLGARNNANGGATLTLILPAVLSMEDAHA